MKTERDRGKKWNFPFLIRHDGIVKRPILFAPQPFSGDSKGLAKSQERAPAFGGTSNSLRFLTLDPFVSLFPKRLEWRSQKPFTILLREENRIG